MVEGYCVKCRKKRTIKGVTKSKNPATSNIFARGKCPVCKTKMVTFMSKKKRRK